MNRLYEIRKKVTDYIKQYNMIEHGDTVVAGVSGGADSMCLLGLLLDFRDIWDIEVVAVHVHHGIRGGEADADMEYVREFCNNMGVEFEGFHFDIPDIALKNHMSLEEAGRIKRYEAFEQVALKKTAQGKRCKIAVAHNIDDGNETFLLNLFRGTGLKGLTGIQPVRDNIIRPVLCLGRKDIVEYLLEKEIEYKTDKTNLDADYTRNKIRLRLLPYIEENINDGVRGNISRTAAMLSEVSSYMEKQALAAYDKNVSIKRVHDSIYAIMLISKELWNEDIIIVKMVIRMAVERAAGRLKDITARHIESIAQLGENQVSRQINLPYDLTAVKTYEGITIKKSEKQGEHIECKNDKSIEFSLDNISCGKYTLEIDEGRFSFCIEKNISADLSEKQYTKMMNCDILKGKLSLRHRRTGDYIVIDSAGRRKKLKDMLIDLKIPRDERDKILLLAKGQEILWIVGYRMSEQCKVDKTDSEICRVSFFKG